MKILFLCGREASYPLNQVLIHSLRTFAEVVVVDENGSGKSIVRRSITVLFEASKELRTQKFNLVFVSFYGHLIMLPLALMTRLPIIFTPFISTYETLVEDRQKFPAWSIPARVAFWLDKISCRLADQLLMDTLANIQYFSKTFSIKKEKFDSVYIGSDENVFFPRTSARTSTENEITVIYHGSYLPLQGVDIIVQAAALINQHPEIRFKMLGRGLEYEKIRRLAKDLGVNNIDFLPPVASNQLPEVIAGATIALGGHFGTSEKASRVIAGKTFQDLAMGKPTIVGDNQANRELLTHGVDAWFCATGDPQALAMAILILARDTQLCVSLGENARNTFLANASQKIISQQLERIVNHMLKA